ncbi:MAG: SPOR domain-containing protein [Prevotella sp.]|nr:SPOR domain-containing protein [Prevotella sp.]
MPDQAKFCERCGLPLERRTVANRQRKENKNSLYALAMILGALLAVIAGAIYFTAFADKKEARAEGAQLVDTPSEQESREQTVKKTVSDDKVSNSPKVYYVVIGSFESLAEAKSFARDKSELYTSVVYKAKDNGKTLYRICNESFHNKADARRYLADCKDGPSPLNKAWIWESDGVAECVYNPDN